MIATVPHSGSSRSLFLHRIVYASARIVERPDIDETPDRFGASRDSAPSLVVASLPALVSLLQKDIHARAREYRGAWSRVRIERASASERERAARPIRLRSRGVQRIRLDEPRDAETRGRDRRNKILENKTRGEEKLLSRFFHADKSEQ